VYSNTPAVSTTFTKQRVPTKRIVQTANGLQEVQSFAEVDVPVEVVDNKQGYRVDEVEDRQLVEIEEVQRFELRPVPVGEPRVVSTRVLGRIPGVAATQRLKGTEVFPPSHPALNGLDEDSRPVSPLGGSQPGSRGLPGNASSSPSATRTSLYRRKVSPQKVRDGYNDPHVLANRGMQPGGVPPARNSYDRSGYVNPS
jgi:hypothetical protein